MSYGQTQLKAMIRQDLEQMNGRRETVKAGFLEKHRIKKISPSELHVNPEDEFTFPNIGPNEAIVANYSQLARRQDSLGMPVFEEPVEVSKLRQGGYLILNGHHRWAGAVMARVPTIRIHVLDP